jgi:hypothetical protein
MLTKNIIASEVLNCFNVNTKESEGISLIVSLTRINDKRYTTSIDEFVERLIYSQCKYGRFPRPRIVLRNALLDNYSDIQLFHEFISAFNVIKMRMPCSFDLVIETGLHSDLFDILMRTLATSSMVLTLYYYETIVCMV